MRAERMDGIESKRRNRTVEENLQIFEEMSKGSEEVGTLFQDNFNSLEPGLHRRFSGSQELCSCEDLSR
jgi:hypothetical protein